MIIIILAEIFARLTANVLGQVKMSLAGRRKIQGKFRGMQVREGGSLAAAKEGLGGTNAVSAGDIAPLPRGRL